MGIRFHDRSTAREVHAADLTPCFLPLSSEPNQCTHLSFSLDANPFSPPSLDGPGVFRSSEQGSRARRSSHTLAFSWRRVESTRWHFRSLDGAMSSSIPSQLPRRVFHLPCMDGHNRMRHGQFPRHTCARQC